MDDADELLMLYDGPTSVLEGRDLASVAKYMNSPQCQRIFVVLGAGVSTAAGIPDFRSPRTGLYARLAKLNLPYPRAVFELNYFRFNPIPFYTFTRELYPGRYRPTLSHSFVKLLADSGRLAACFTQNIDTLERQAGIPAELLVEANGSFASQRCIDCKQPFDSEKMRRAVENGDVVRCDKSSCGGLVKPDIVFFGESLPERFFQSMPRIGSADLLFVIGTSLTVQPFAKLVSMVPERCPRILINLDFAGDIGTRADDVLLLGKCDAVVRDLARALGWEAALDAEWAQTALTLTAAPATPATAYGAMHTADVDKALRMKDAALPPHEQVEIGSGISNGTSTPTAAEWQEKLDAASADSLTERLMVALESSEKVVPLLEETAITFAARTLSAEELLLGSGVDSPLGEEPPFSMAGSPIALEGKS